MSDVDGRRDWYLGNAGDIPFCSVPCRINLGRNGGFPVDVSFDRYCSIPASSVVCSRIPLSDSLEARSRRGIPQVIGCGGSDCFETGLSGRCCLIARDSIINCLGRAAIGFFGRRG